jgi:hypothetical protein
MKTVCTKVAVMLAVLALAGCSNGSSLLNAKSNVPQANNVPVGNSLAMPPDLQLAVPNQTSENYEPNGPVVSDIPDSTLAAPTTKPMKKMASAAPVAPIPVKQDLYDQYGISKLDADGKPKKPELLQAELKAAILKKKRETNPNYGTISNIGAIFDDQ